MASNNFQSINYIQLREQLQSARCDLALVQSLLQQNISDIEDDAKSGAWETLDRVRTTINKTCQQLK